MYSKYLELKKQAGVTDYRVSKETGIPTSALTNWKKNHETKGKEGYMPKVDKMQALATYFKVPLEYFYAADSDKEDA
ncbi:MAG: helix-turn-helix domain-containing protein [Hungatella sp.]|nr:helix-turn-helix domain-containing protein [Hungatella sp.]